jgi:hypothetical protein
LFVQAEGGSMDAHGNLTSPDEFDGVTIRLISYQPGPDGSVSSLGADLEVVVLANPETMTPGPAILVTMVCLAVTEPTPYSPPPTPQYLQFKVAGTGAGGFTLVPDGLDMASFATFPKYGVPVPGGIYLSASTQGPLVLAAVDQGAQPGVDQTFHVDFLQGDCWFSLYYTTDQDYFAGVSGMDTDGRPAIAGISWNNDPTQIWRAEVVTDVASRAVAAADTRPAAAPPVASKSANSG